MERKRYRQWNKTCGNAANLGVRCLTLNPSVLISHEAAVLLRLSVMQQPSFYIFGFTNLTIVDSVQHYSVFTFPK